MSSNTLERTVVVTNRHGLHARPCLAIVNTVGRHDAKVIVQKGDETVEAGSVPALMSLGAAQGTELILQASGPDAADVLQTLNHLFLDEFGVSYPNPDPQDR
jgi:phosphocarrier protein HPr